MGKAAESLGVNTSTVSRRIRVLEEALDVRLLERLPGGTRLTQDGEELLTSALETEAKVLALTRRASKQRASLSGRVRVSAAAAAARQLLHAFHPFYELYPNIAISWHTAEESADLLRREADIGVRFYRPETPDLVAKRVGRYDWGIYGSTSYLELQKEVSVEKLDWICYEHPKIETNMDRWTQRWIPEVRKRMTTFDVTSMVIAVQQGLGVALLPASTVSFEAPELVKLGLDVELPPPTPIWLVAHEDLDNIPRIRAVWDYLEGLLE